MKPYGIYDSELEKKLLILLSVLTASKSNNELVKDFETDKFPRIFPVEWRLIEENLISSAISIRIIDDQLNKYGPGDLKFEFPFENCGVLMKDKNNNKEPLTLREACNKIIHAINYEADQFSSHPIFTRITTHVKFEGTQHGKKWKADLDVKQFVCNALYLITLNIEYIDYFPDILTEKDKLTEEDQFL